MLGFYAVFMVRIIRINAKVSPCGALRGRPASCIVLSSEYDNRSGEQESHWELNMLVGLLSLLSFFSPQLELSLQVSLTQLKCVHSHYSLFQECCSFRDSIPQTCKPLCLGIKYLCSCSM